MLAVLQGVLIPAVLQGKAAEAVQPVDSGERPGETEAIALFRQEGEIVRTAAVVVLQPNLT